MAAAALLLVLLVGSGAGARAETCRVYLVPGALGTSGGSTYFIRAEDYFKEYEDFFKAKGCEVGRAAFPQDLTVQARAMMIRDLLPKFDGGKPSVIIAHSQGGLDARFALGRGGLSEVRAVISIGVPHQGTPVADWVVDQRKRRTLVYQALKLGGYDLRGLAFASQLTPMFLERNSRRFEPVAGVRYASAVADCQRDCAWSLRLLRWWMGFADGDGMVPASSQRFGEDLGTYDLDHLSEIGVDEAKRPERLRLLERMNQVVQQAFAGPSR